MRIQGLKAFAMMMILLLSSYQAFAAFSFEGYLADANGNPITGSVTVHLKVLSPGSEACPLFVEDQAITVPSDGYVSLPIGNGTRLDTPTYTLDRVFANFGTLSGLSGCASGTTYTPAAGAKRLLAISVTVGATTENLGSLDINPVPVAMNAEKLGAHTVGSLVRVESSGIPSAATALTTSDFSNLQSLVAGSSTLYMKNTASGSALPSFASNPGSPVAGNMWYDSTLHQVKFYDGSAVQSLAGGVSLPPANGATSGYLVNTDWTAFNSKLGPSTSFAGDISGTYNSMMLSATGVSVGTYTKVTVDAKGRVTTATNISSADVAAALGYSPLNKSGDAMTGILGLYSTASDPSTAGWGAPDKGKTWFNNTSNQVKYWDGSAIQVLGVAGSGLSSLNGQVGATQTFAISNDNSIAQPMFASGTNVHTLKFPQATAPGVTGGLVAYTDATNWSAKLGPASVMAGDVSGTFSTTTVNRIQGYSFTLSSPVVGQVLRYNGAVWQNGGIDGNDIISGVLPVSRGGTGGSAYSANRVIVSNGTGTILQSFTCTLNQVLSFDASGNTVCANVTSLLPAMDQIGGNSMAMSISLGTNDNYNLALRTNAIDRVVIDTAGRVGIGSMAPIAPLDLTGFMTFRGQSGASGSSASQGNLFFNNIKNKFQFSENGGPYFDLLSPAGNAMASDISIGPMDSYKLNLMTTGIPRVTIAPSGNVGIGTTMPQATLEVGGHIGGTGPTVGTPTGSGCGTSPSASGTDTRGKLTYGSSPTTGYCQINFMSAYMTPPICVVSWATAPGTMQPQVTTTTTYLQISFTTAPSAASVLNYICLQ